MFEGYIICYITFIFIKEIVGSIFIIELKLTIFAFKDPFQVPQMQMIDVRDKKGSCQFNLCLALKVFVQIYVDLNYMLRFNYHINLNIKDTLNPTNSLLNENLQDFFFFTI